jgi:hypothetical protein
LEERDGNRYLLGLDRRNKGKKGSEPFNVQSWKRKKKGLNGFVKREFDIGYEVVEAKLYHKYN